MKPVNAEITLQPHLGAGEKAEERNDADRSPDQRQAAGAHGHVSQQPGDLLLVTPQRLWRPPEGTTVEGELASEIIKSVQRLLRESFGAAQGATGRTRHDGRHYKPFGGMTWK
jgi:hypothetical protein